MKFEHVLVMSMLLGAFGHGALTKPLPRLVSGQQYCPWCVGEHQPVTNPSGVVNRDAEPSSPCLGSQIGDAPYPSSNYNNYAVATAPAEPHYTAGGTMEATIVLDADHNGEAIFDYCPHSEAQTEECFRSRPLNDWTDVHAYWDASNQDDHWKSGSWFPQTVNLPADMPSGPVTVRWLWICKYTDEIFVSCVDVDIVGGAATTTAIGTTTTTTASPECIWTEPAGRTLERTPREEKDGRVCWDVTVPAGTKVYYQSKTDIYHAWNSNSCCLSAADSFGSDATGSPNLVVFTPTANVGTFGFCECTAWDPSNPGACAGAATADNMICPVLGASKEMCSEAASWDGLPVGCTPVFSTTPSATSTTTMVSTTSPTDGCCYWDANKGCEGSGYCWESKANCEGTCNGKWLANTPPTTTPATTMAPTTMATTATTTPIYTTTISATTTPIYTTTISATTTTVPATTATSSDGFEPVDGGVNRACRGDHAGDNDASYFTVVSVDSLDECKARCLATAGCHGIENIGKRCELWTHPVSASISLDGYVCLRLAGGPVTTTSHPLHSSCGQLHDQCGGDANYMGSSCCVSGLTCEYKDSKYSQCAMDEASPGSCAQIWQQCGGAGWTGSSCCVEGLTCVWGNEHYSQCLRLPGSLIQADTKDVRVGKKRTHLRKSRRPAALESRPWLVQRRTATAKTKATEPKVTEL